MKDRLTSYLGNWNFMRLLRFSMGIYVGIQAITAHSWSFGAISALFLFQAISNIGCCGSGCDTRRF